MGNRNKLTWRVGLVVALMGRLAGADPAGPPVVATGATAQAFVPPMRLIESTETDAGAPGAACDDRIACLLAHPGLTKALALTPPQSVAIAQRLEEYRKKSGELRTAIEKAGMDQARLLSLPKTDEKAILQAIKVGGDLRTRLAQLQMQQLLFLRRTLNPGQIEKLQPFIERELTRQDGKGKQDKQRK